MSPSAGMSSKVRVPPTSAIQSAMSRRDPHRTGQLLQGAGALGLALAAHPQYEHEDELPEQTGSGPGGAPAPRSPMKNGHRWQSHPGAGSNNLKLAPPDGRVPRWRAGGPSRRHNATVVPRSSSPPTTPAGR